MGLARARYGANDRPIPTVTPKSLRLAAPSFNLPVACQRPVTPGDLMPDDDLLSPRVEPVPIPEIEPHGAQSRPGFKDPIGAVIDRVEFSRPIPDGVIADIELVELCRNKWRNPADDPRFYPALERLRIVVVVLATSDDPGAPEVLRRANAALPKSWRYGHDDTSRLDFVIAYANRGQTYNLWSRDTIDRLMEDT